MSISIAKNRRSKVSQVLTLPEIYDKIVNPTRSLRDISKKIREGDKTFKDHLPQMLPAGRVPVGGRKSLDNITGPTGFVCLDIDDVGFEAFQKYKFRFLSWNLSSLAFASPSYGVKIFVRVDGSPSVFTHKLAFARAKAEFEKAFSDTSFTVDPAGAKITQGCYLVANGKDDAALNPCADGIEITEQEARDAYDRHVRRQAQEEELARKARELGGSVSNGIQKAERFADRKAGTYTSGNRDNWAFYFVYGCVLAGVEEKQADQIVRNLPGLDDNRKTRRIYRQNRSRFGVWAVVEAEGKQALEDYGVEPDPEAVLEREPEEVPARYATEKSEEFLAFIGLNKKSMIQAQTGAGKTTLILENREKIGPAAMLVPTKLLANQLAAETGLPCLTGDTAPADRETAKRADFVVATYDQALNVVDKERTMIVDEIHLLPVSGYRDTGKAPTCKTILDLSEVAKRTIGLSATPPESFGLLGFEELKLNVGTKPRTRFQCFEAEKDLISGGYQMARGVAEAFDLVILRVNSKKRLIAIENLLQSYYGEGSTLIVNADTQRSPEVAAFIETGRLEDSVKFLLTTSILETGFSVRRSGTVANIAVIDRKERNAAAVRQLFSRPRNATEIRNFLILSPDKKKEVGEKLPTRLDMIRGLYGEMLGFCERVNEINESHPLGTTSFRPSQPPKTTRFVPTSGRFEPDFLEIERFVEKKRNEQRTNAEFLTEIEQYFTECPVEFCGPLLEYVSKELHEEITQVKDACRVSNATGSRLLKNNEKTALIGAYAAGSETVRHKIRKSGAVSKEELEKAEAVAEGFKDNYVDQDQPIVQHYLSLRKIFGPDSAAQVMEELTNRYLAQKTSSEKEALFKQDVRDGDLWFTTDHRFKTFFKDLEGVAVLRLSKDKNLQAITSSELIDHARRTRNFVDDLLKVASRRKITKEDIFREFKKKKSFGEGYAFADKEILDFAKRFITLKGRGSYEAERKSLDWFCTGYNLDREKVLGHFEQMFTLVYTKKKTLRRKSEFEKELPFETLGESYRKTG